MTAAVLLRFSGEYECTGCPVKSFHSLIPYFCSKISEKMCLETHFQYEYSILDRFGQSGRREKTPNCHKYATFEASFLCFHGQKTILFILIPENSSIDGMKIENIENN